MIKRTPLLLGLTLSAAAATAFVLWPEAPASNEPVAASAPVPAPATVETAPALARESTASVWVPASVVSRNDARIAGEVAGRLVFVAEIGSRIEAGQAVARIDESTLQLEVREAEALIGRRRAEQDQAARQLERLQALRDNRLVAVSQLDEAESNLEIRRRETAQAEVARDRARQRLAIATMRAPFNGVVVERLAQVGEYQQAGAAAVRLVETDSVELSARAPAALASLLAIGQDVPVRHDNRVRNGRIRAVVPAADQVSRQLELRLELNDGDWLVGSAAEVALPQTATRLAVTAPRDALVLRPEGSYVFRIRDDGTAERVLVVAGELHDDYVEIDGEIAIGDVLIVRGAERLRDGQPVVVRAHRDAEDDAVLVAINTAMKAG